VVLWSARPGTVAAARTAELAVRRHRPAAAIGEHISAGPVAGPRRGGFGALAAAVLAQRRNGGVIQS
jgi:hypothetical protein